MTTNLHGMALIIFAILVFPGGLDAELDADSSDTVHTQYDILAMALESSFTVREERIGADAAEERVRAARGLFDPTFEGGYRYSHRDGPGGERGVDEPARERTVREADVGLRGLVPGGGEYGVFLDTGLVDAASREPFADAAVSITGVQPLLRGFRRGPEWSAIRVARNRAYYSDQDFHEAVMNVAADVLIAYNDLVFAQRSLEVMRRNEGLARQLLQDNRNRVRRGAMAPMDVLQAESAVALREGLVLEAGQALREANNFLLSQIHEDLAPHLGIRLTVRHAEVPELSPGNVLADYDRALALRPDYRRALLNVELREIELERARNQALPRLDLFGSYGFSGVGASRRESFRDLGEGSGEFYSAGVRVGVPIPGRTAQADRVAAWLHQRRSEVALDRHRQQILLIIDTANHRLETHWRRLAVARQATRLAHQALEAEEEKLSAGLSSSFVVLRLQEDVGNAERREALTERDYMNAVIRRQYAVGTILEDYRILVPDGGRRTP